MGRTIIIAEAGVNHNGDLNLAKGLIDAAAESGADYVKFQTFKTNNLLSKSAEKAEYQKKNTAEEDENQFAMLKKLELSASDHQILIQHCKTKGIEFLSSAFDNDALDYLNETGLPLFKVPSGELTNYPYLKKLAQIGKPVILSTGMANMDEIRDAIELLLSDALRKEDLSILHCNTDYPTPMPSVKSFFRLKICSKSKYSVRSVIYTFEYMKGDSNALGPLVVRSR